MKLEVRLQDESIWLTQQLIADLFKTTVSNISMHMRNIYQEGELTPEATVKKFLTVRREGKLDVRREAPGMFVRPARAAASYLTKSQGIIADRVITVQPGRQ